MAGNIDAGASRDYDNFDWRDVGDDLDEDFDEEDEEIMNDAVSAWLPPQIKTGLQIAQISRCRVENRHICKKVCGGGWWFTRKCRNLCYYRKENVCS